MQDTLVHWRDTNGSIDRLQLDSVRVLEHFDTGECLSLPDMITSAMNHLSNNNILTQFLLGAVRVLTNADQSIEFKDVITVRASIWILLRLQKSVVRFPIDWMRSLVGDLVEYRLEYKVICPKCDLSYTELMQIYKLAASSYVHRVDDSSMPVVDRSIRFNPNKTDRWLACEKEC
jgi:hypothetical protein